MTTIYTTKNGTKISAKAGALMAEVGLTKLGQFVQGAAKIRTARANADLLTITQDGDTAILTLTKLGRSVLGTLRRKNLVTASTTF